VVVAWLLLVLGWAVTDLQRAAATDLQLGYPAGHGQGSSGQQQRSCSLKTATAAAVVDGAARETAAVVVPAKLVGDGEDCGLGRLVVCFGAMGKEKKEEEEKVRAG
jgi:hypothetical protein